jgi:hypothetical protein
LIFVTLDAQGIIPGQDRNKNQCVFCQRYPGPGNVIPHRVASSTLKCLTISLLKLNLIIYKTHESKQQACFTIFIDISNYASSLVYFYRSHDSCFILNSTCIVSLDSVYKSSILLQYLGDLQCPQFCKLWSNIRYI